MQNRRSSLPKLALLAGALALFCVAAFLLSRTPPAAVTSPVVIPVADLTAMPDDSPAVAVADDAVLEEDVASAPPANVPARAAELTQNGFRKVTWNARRQDDRRAVLCTVAARGASNEPIVPVAFDSHFRPTSPSMGATRGILFVPPKAAMLVFQAQSALDLEESRVPVPADGTKLEVLFEAGHGFVAGQVVDESGTPLPGMPVTLNGRIRRTSDSIGAFRFEPLADGAYNLALRSDALAPSRAARESVIVSEGRPDRAALLRVARGATVRGRVVLAGTRAPVAGARIVLTRGGTGPTARGRDASYRETSSDRDGAFKIGWLAADDYQLATRVESGGVGRSVMPVPAVSAGEEREVEVALTSGAGTIHGALTDPDGKPIPFAVLQARESKSGTTITARTGSTGEFELTQLAPGTWTLGLEPEYREAFNWTPVGTPSVALADGANVAAELHVKPGAFLRGAIDSAAHRTGLVVRVTADDGTVLTKSVGQEGGFAFGALATGTYLVEVLDPAAENRPLAMQRVTVDGRAEKVRISVP